MLQRLVAAAAGDQVIDLTGFKCPVMMIAAAADGQVIDHRVVALLLKDSAWRQAAGSPRALLKAAAFYTRTTIEGVLPTIPFPLRGECLTEWVPEWAAHFIEVPQELLLEIVCLACSTGLMQLANLACARVASLMRQAPKYIQRTFNIVMDAMATATRTSAMASMTSAPTAPGAAAAAKVVVAAVACRIMVGQLAQRTGVALVAPAAQIVGAVTIEVAVEVH